MTLFQFYQVEVRKGTSDWLSVVREQGAHEQGELLATYSHPLHYVKIGNFSLCIYSNPI
ncbi:MULTISPECIES: hypothetical protein [Chroococcidiopsis]|uniref:hypothetical protein n=1 Tax=Chroococcidiopsis TaxID=54298 RepID=UPI0020210C2E|nr:MULTISPECIES: hypothetical protein [Chroococcidiopsis]URD49277.1 hypothetical protein M5J74_23505 [Chroococcidiopsis sp. CCNUC1]